MPRIAILALILALAACRPDSTKLPPPAKPVLVETVKVVYVPISAALTRQVTDPAPAPGKTGGDLLRGYDARGQALLQCNGQLEGVAAVQGTPAKPC